MSVGRRSETRSRPITVFKGEGGAETRAASYAMRRNSTWIIEGDTSHSRLNEKRVAHCLTQTEPGNSAARPEITESDAPQRFRFLRFCGAVSFDFPLSSLSQIFAQSLVEMDCRAFSTSHTSMSIDYANLCEEKNEASTTARREKMSSKYLHSSSCAKGQRRMERAGAVAVRPVTMCWAVPITHRRNVEVRN